MMKSDALDAASVDYSDSDADKGETLYAAIASSR